MSDTSVAGLAVRLIGSLAVVVGLLFLLARMANKRFKSPTGATVQLVARQSLTRSAGVSVLTIGSRVLVVGTTEQSVSLLAELDPEELVEELGLEPDAVDADQAETDAAEPAKPPAGVPPRRPRPQQPAAPLAGSLLSPTTWKQTMAAITGSPPPGERKAS